MGFSHVAVYGMSGYGKSTFMKGQAAKLASKVPVVVFNPTGEGGWPKNAIQAQSADTLEYILAKMAGKKKVLFVDEARILRLNTHQRKHPKITSMGTTGRHDGTLIFAASQFVTGMDTALRWNCGKCMCFRLGNVDDAQEVWKIYNYQHVKGVPLWQVILRLKHFECLVLTQETAEIRLIKKPR